MAKDNELGSVVEYDVDIATQEAPPPLPVRDYTAEIREAKVAISQKGTKYARVAFYISPDQYPADFTEGDPDGTTLTYMRVSLENKPSARFGVRKFCEAIGAPMSKRIDVNEWVGLTATVSVEHEPYEGVDRAVIKTVSPV